MLGSGCALCIEHGKAINDDRVIYDETFPCALWLAYTRTCALQRNLADSMMSTFSSLRNSDLMSFVFQRLNVVREQQLVCSPG